MVLAECTMQCIEELILQNTFAEIKKWIQYVDDNFAVIPISQKEEFFNFINGINCNIKFTCEEETHFQIAFLDLKILKSVGGLLKFKIHRMPTNINQFLYFNSDNPSNPKGALGKFENAAPRKFMESCHSINMSSKFNRFVEISCVYLPIFEEVFPSHNYRNVDRNIVYRMALMPI